MAIFNRKITLWLNDENVTLGDILDAAYDVCEGDPADMIVGEERGRYEQFCDCGNWECANKRPVEVAQ